MASIKEIAKGRSDTYKVSPFDLHEKEDWNSRDYEDPANIEHIDTIAQSIAAEGVKEPLTIYFEDGKAYVENGHIRRLAALKAIESYGAPQDMTVPVRTSGTDLSPADRLLSQIIRNSGKPFSPLEQAKLFKKLNAADLSDAEIARRAGISRTYVGQLKALGEMPKKVTDYVKTGKVSATLAIKLVKDHDGDAAKVAADMKSAVGVAKAAGKDKATEKHVREVKGEPKTERKPRTAAEPDKTPDAPKRDLGPLAPASATATDEQPEASAAAPKVDEFDLVGELRAIFERTDVEDVNDVDEGKITRADFKGEDYDRILELIGLTFEAAPAETKTERNTDDV